MEAVVVSDISCAFATTPECSKYVTWTAFTHIVYESNDLEPCVRHMSEYRS